MVLTVQQETTLQTLHTQYVEATKQNYPNAYIFSLEEVMNNVNENAKPDDDIEALTKSVLEAMLYMSSNSIAGMIERAESDFIRRFEDMNQQQRQVCMQYRLKFS